MLDLHCHILPGVDDGARNMQDSLRMLAAAHAAGVTAMVCTPHCRDPYFDYAAMLDAFDAFKAAATEQPEEHGGKIKLTMGFEVNWAKLCEFGVRHAKKLAFREGVLANGARPNGSAAGNASNGAAASNATLETTSPRFLFELPSALAPRDYREVFYAIDDLQAAGLDVIIAHPERYWAIQDNLGIAFDLVEAGCKLQASADFIEGGREGGVSQETAMALFKEGLYSYIASDAHNVRHYELLSAAVAEYGPLLI